MALADLIAPGELARTRAHTKHAAANQNIAGSSKARCLSSRQKQSKNAKSNPGKAADDATETANRFGLSQKRQGIQHCQNHGSHEQECLIIHTFSP